MGEGGTRSGPQNLFYQKSFFFFFFIFKLYNIILVLPNIEMNPFLYNPVGTDKKGADWVGRAKGWSLQIQGPGALFCFL